MSNIKKNQMGGRLHFAHLSIWSIKFGARKYITNMHLPYDLCKILYSMHKIVYIYIERNIQQKLNCVFQS